MDVFTWSIPFVAEKVAGLLMKILEVCNEDDEELSEEEMKAAKRERIRAKIRAIGRMQAMCSSMSEKNMSLLNRGSDGMLQSEEKAEKLGKVNVREADLHNEKRPEL